MGLHSTFSPFAGIAFLWFVGALRDRLGGLEDRFFSTVFLGSSLLFLAMLFVSAAVIGALILTFAVAHSEVMNAATFHFARTFIYNLVNIYMIRMAAVFMISTSTVVIFTDIAPRWVAYLGFALALLLLFGSSYISVGVCRLSVLGLSDQRLPLGRRVSSTAVGSGHEVKTVSAFSPCLRLLPVPAHLPHGQGRGPRDWESCSMSRSIDQLPLQSG